MSIFDSDVVSRITDALLNDPRTKDAIIEVSNQGGTVTLSGTVPSQEIREAAVEIVRQQKGVISVVNELSIQAGQEGVLPPVLRI